MMTERRDSVAADDPWLSGPARPQSFAEAKADELDQAVRDLQDLARVRLAAPPQPRRRRGKSRS